MNHTSLITQFPRSRKQAFTLVELMTTLLIIGILAAIAVVSYSSYIARTRMAEGYQMMDTITKSEVTYYTFHKVFRYASDNPMLTSAGLPSTKVPFLDTPSWSELGYPVAVGTPVSFVSMAYPGKVDASGTEVTVTLTSGTQQTTTQNLLFGHSFLSQPWAGNSVNGTCDELNSEDFISVNGKTDYKWVAIILVANLKPENSLIDKCTWIYRLVDTNDRDEVSTNVVQVRNSGE